MLDFHFATFLRPFCDVAVGSPCDIQFGDVAATFISFWDISFYVPPCSTPGSKDTNFTYSYQGRVDGDGQHSTVETTARSDIPDDATYVIEEPQQSDDKFKITADIIKVSYPITVSCHKSHN